MTHLVGFSKGFGASANQWTLGMPFADVHIENRLAKVHTSRPILSELCALCGKKTLRGQQKNAKRNQFSNTKNEPNLLLNNDLRTCPFSSAPKNETNQIQSCHSCESRKPDPLSSKRATRHEPKTHNALRTTPDEIMQNEPNFTRPDPRHRIPAILSKKFASFIYSIKLLSAFSPNFPLHFQTFSNVSNLPTRIFPPKINSSPHNLLATSPPPP
jgi:hypothetical protein